MWFATLFTLFTSCFSAGKKRLLLTLAVTSLSIPNIAFAADVGPFESATPDSQGINQSDLQKALNFIVQNAGKDGISKTIVLRNGKAIYAGDKVDVIHNVYSVTKSFTSTALGLLIEENKISLDTPICEIDAQYCQRYPNVTFRHLSTMTSGYNADGENRWGEESKDWSKTPFAVGNPLFAPNTAYAYWDEAMIVLGHLLTIVAQESLYDYLDRRLMKPIGIKKWSWWHEPKFVARRGFEIAGNAANNGALDTVPLDKTALDITALNMNYGAGGIELSAIDLALYGQLFLQQGKWEQAGKTEQIIPKNWIKQATQNQIPLTINTANTDRSAIRGVGYYGFNWWVNGQNSQGEWQMPSAPKNMYYARGFNNNMLFIIPQWEMVIVAHFGDVEAAPE